MNQDQVKSALARIIQDVDTGHKVLDSTIRTEVRLVHQRITTECLEFESLERKAARDIIQEADPSTKEWLDAVWLYFGSAALIGDACDRSARTVEGWYAGRPVPASAATLLRQKSKGRA